MRSLFLLCIFASFCAGCTVDRSGSEALHIDPLGSGPAIETANGPGYMNGERQDLRNRY